MSRKLNRVSARITQEKAQGASQAMLHATGLSVEDLDKPQLGIAAMWYDGNPCNMHLGLLADAVREGARGAGLVGFRFFTIGVSDGMSMGTEGMSYSLQSRDLIADSIETVMSAQWYDANVSIPGCDKNMPGCVMAMGRLNRPALMVYILLMAYSFTAQMFPAAMVAFYTKTTSGTPVGTPASGNRAGIGFMSPA